ncbi:eukaryotic translation initiation factor 4E-like [Babylonia areolata]|uniref:eukaryotic translation initiation factor 4E-like n=1 Tax=Babylonia areolata TaxID=304850 RepID=UPI003FD1D106
MNETPVNSMVNGHDEEMEPEEAAMSSPAKWIKHPLNHQWTLWYFKMDRNRDWCENNIIVTTFATVEDFWCLVNHIQKASKLNSGCDYSVFKDGIQPMWEDPQNKEGGRWLINMNKNQRHTDLDNVWLEMLLCLIGEAFDPYGEEICGAVVNIRPKGDKLGVWTKDCNHQDAIMHIGRTLRDRLNVPKSCTIGYQAHNDNCVKTGSAVKNRYQV